MQLIEQSEATAARRRVLLELRNDVNNITPVTGASISVSELQLSKNGGAEANNAGSTTEIGGGLYYYEATVGELDTLGVLGLRIDKSGVRARVLYAQVVPWDPYSTFTVSGGVNVEQINASATAAAQLAKSANTIISGTVDSTSFTPTTTAFEADDITEATANHYIGRVIIFTSGALQNQITDITAYELSGSNGKFSVTAMTDAPENNATFIIV